MSRYASAGGGSVNASREFKEMVKALHSSGIEVVMLILYYHNLLVEVCLTLLFSGFLLFYIISSLIYLLCLSLNLIHTQVILDVVYNHTNEADDANPYTTSFRGIDNKVTSICIYCFDRLCYLHVRIPEVKLTLAVRF